MKLTRHLRIGTAGLSLVELLFTVVLLTMVIGALALVGRASDQAYRTGATASQLEAQAAATTERMIAELRVAGRQTIAPDPIQGVGSDGIQYLQAVGIGPAGVQWTPLRRLAFEYEQGELDNGLDDNGNGLADEGLVVLTEDVGGQDERRRVLTRWVREFLEGELDNAVDDNGNGLVNERGFFLERIEGTLIVRLTLQRTTSDGHPLIRTAQTSTKLRN